jgi:hypothetical protein
MLSFFDMVVAALAVWRLAHMFKSEAGPWDIFIRIREKLGNSMLGRMMDCGACMSVWLSIIIFIPGTKYLVIIMAISALAMLLEGLHALLRGENSERRFIPKKPAVYKDFLPGGGTGL